MVAKTERDIELIAICDCRVLWLKEIGALKKLTQLDVSDNKLERLPDTIGELDGLTDLLLSENQIDYLPDSFGLCAFAAVVISDESFKENLSKKKQF